MVDPFQITHDHELVGNCVSGTQDAGYAERNTTFQRRLSQAPQYLPSTHDSAPGDIAICVTRCYCRWMNSVRTTLKPWLKSLFAGICRGIIIPGFLRWCEMGFVHPQHLGPPVVPFYPFWGRVPLLKSTTEKNWYPYSNLFTGGPRHEGTGHDLPIASPSAPGADLFARRQLGSLCSCPSPDSARATGKMGVDTLASCGFQVETHLFSQQKPAFLPSIPEKGNHGWFFSGQFQFSLPA